MSRAAKCGQLPAASAKFVATKRRSPGCDQNNNNLSDVQLVDQVAVPDARSAAAHEAHGGRTNTRRGCCVEAQQIYGSILIKDQLKSPQ